MLNLLPPEYKLEITKRTLWHAWRQAALTLAMVAALSTGGLLLGQQRLQQQANDVNQNIAALRQAKTETPSQDITAVTTKLNTTIASLGKMIISPRSSADDLATVTGILPPGVTVQSLIITSSGAVTIQGVASTRLSFIALDDALKNSPLLEQVKTASTASKRENIPFTYTAVLKASTPLPS